MTAFLRNWIIQHRISYEESTLNHSGDLIKVVTKLFHFLGGATCLGRSLSSHKMQRTFLNCRKSVDLVSARALNNQARYNDVDFTRLKGNVSNTGRFVGDMTIFACEA